MQSAVQVYECVELGFPVRGCKGPGFSKYVLLFLLESKYVLLFLLTGAAGSGDSPGESIPQGGAAVVSRGTSTAASNEQAG